MARYTNDIMIQTGAQEAYAAVMQFLCDQGYEYIQYGGEDVFKKGNGILSGPTFFKFTYGNNVVHMETWMKYALLPGVYVGEYAIKGFVGAAVKGPWKQRVLYLEHMLSNLRPDNNTAPQAAAEANRYDTQVFNETNSGQAGFDADCGVQSSMRAETAVIDDSESTFCSACGAKLKNGAEFCTNCGAPIENGKFFNEPLREDQIGSSTFGNTVNTRVSPIRQHIGRKEYINEYAPQSLKNDVRNVAIGCYVLVGLSAVLSIVINPVGIIESLLLLGLALGMHLGKSKVCAVLIFALSIAEVLIGIIVGVSVGYLWPIVGIFALVTFNKIDKQYLQFMSDNNLQ